MKRIRTPLSIITLLAVCFSSNSCIFFTVTPECVDMNRKTVYSWASARVHLRDGSVIIFPRGFSMAKGVIKGDHGVRYDLMRHKSGYVDSVSRDSVACVQVYKDKLVGARSAVGLVAVPVFVFTLMVAALPHMGRKVGGHE